MFRRTLGAAIAMETVSGRETATQPDEVEAAERSLSPRQRPVPIHSFPGLDDATMDIGDVYRRTKAKAAFRQFRYVDLG